MISVTYEQQKVVYEMFLFKILRYTKKYVQKEFAVIYSNTVIK